MGCVVTVTVSKTQRAIAEEVAVKTCPGPEGHLQEMEQHREAAFGYMKLCRRELAAQRPDSPPEQSASLPGLS